MRCDWFIVSYLFINIFITDRHSEGDARAQPGGPALHPDAPAVRFDDAARDSQSHSQSSRPPQTRRALGGGAEELVENALAQLRRYPAPFFMIRSFFFAYLEAGDFGAW
jgi:hypothetical protein